MNSVFVSTLVLFLFYGYLSGHVIVFSGLLPAFSPAPSAPGNNPPGSLQLMPAAISQKLLHGAFQSRFPRTCISPATSPFPLP